MKRILCLAPIAVLLFAADPWMPQDLIEPSALAARLPLKASGPMLISTGFPVLYRASHIPGSIYAGPGSKAEGIEDLKKAVSGQPKDREIILYCGCCPMDKCPNLRPAFTALREMGFTKVHALRLPENMHTDWAGHGYPVEKSAEKSN